MKRIIKFKTSSYKLFFLKKRFILNSTSPEVRESEAILLVYIWSYKPDALLNMYKAKETHLNIIIYIFFLCKKNIYYENNYLIY